MDSSLNFYTEATAAKVTAPSNNGVVLAVTFTLTGDVKECSADG
jgi:hypothetical protein